MMQHIPIQIAVVVPENETESSHAAATIVGLENQVAELKNKLAFTIILLLLTVAMIFVITLM